MRNRKKTGVCGKLQRTKLRVQVGIPIATPVVILDHFLQGGQAPVMHVGSRALHLAQGRRLERPTVFFLPGDGEAAQIEKLAITPGDAGVMETFVGEVRADVAGRAVGLAAK